MTCKHLDVPDGPADHADFLGGIGDERPTTGMGRATEQSEFLIPVKEHVDDCLRGGRLASLGRDDI